MLDDANIVRVLDVVHEKTKEDASEAARSLREQLAANLRRLRADAEWTQQEAASRAQLAFRAYQVLEAGTANPTLSTLSRLGQAFGVDVTQLLQQGAELPPRRPGRPLRVKSGVSGASLRTQILLVVGADPVRTFLTAFLSARSYQVTNAETSAEARKLLDRRRFDIVLCDEALPDKRANEVLEAATAHSDGRTAGLLLMKTPQRLARDDMMAVPKPLDLDVFVRTLEAIKEKSKAAAKSNPKVSLVLYTTRGSSASRRAIRNIERVLAAFEPDDWDLSIHDLETEVAAPKDKVVFTPSLVVRRGTKRMMLVGDLADSKGLLEILETSGVRTTSA